MGFDALSSVGVFHVSRLLCKLLSQAKNIERRIGISVEFGPYCLVRTHTHKHAPACVKNTFVESAFCRRAIGYILPSCLILLGL